MKELLTALALMLCSAPAPSAPVQQPDLTFTIQTEKQIFRRGEPVWVMALLHNQGTKDIYVPHAMTECSGGESRIEFSLTVIKGKEATHARGCGSGISCDHCSPPPFAERVRTTWVLLRPGEIFGARMQSTMDASDTPGVYKLQARYVPSVRTEAERASLAKDLISIVTETYDAAPVEITVRR